MFHVALRNGYAQPARSLSGVVGIAAPEGLGNTCSTIIPSAKATGSEPMALDQY